MSDSTSSDEQKQPDTQNQVSAKNLGSENAPADPASQADAHGPPAAKQRRKGGAPLGNRNAHRHGLYSPRGPKASKYAERQAGVFRRHLENCVTAEHGEISILDACLIDTATQAARMALDELRELREMYDDLDSGQRSGKRQSAMKFLDTRDRKIRELGIVWRPEAGNGDEIDPFKILDEENRLPTEPPPAEKN